ncbi:MAG: YHS domain-containing protein, partial [Gammaproteobacteria bacterium]|nr:YHS domain-containing protein [Gammaproteobacteria bacterium]NIR47966.1 YHS domain-containing protein [candidate division KSB1 bacterium]NIQ11506.1 YHS domain-containing protein [Gammaproteobacteria bacterium]NIS23492.1 YHS domain-containing protein [candidate division KSB1 bacterium]NIU23075.1 YHS domain-containing protein [candidate division KSB1 bacterium]
MGIRPDARQKKSQQSLKGLAMKDPVCGMTVEQDKAAGTTEYQGETYY